MALFTEPILSPCPCGAPAAWYYVYRHSHVSLDGSVTEMVMTDLAEHDYCDTCFYREMPTDEASAGWVRLPISDENGITLSADSERL